MDICAICGNKDCIHLKVNPLWLHNKINKNPMESPKDPIFFEPWVIPFFDYVDILPAELSQEEKDKLTKTIKEIAEIAEQPKFFELSLWFKPVEQTPYDKLIMVIVNPE